MIDKSNITNIINMTTFSFRNVTTDARIFQPDINICDVYYMDIFLKGLLMIIVFLTISNILVLYTEKLRLKIFILLFNFGSLILALFLYIYITENTTFLIALPILVFINIVNISITYEKIRKFKQYK